MFAEEINTWQCKDYSNLCSLSAICSETPINTGAARGGRVLRKTHGVFRNTHGVFFKSRTLLKISRRPYEKQCLLCKKNLNFLKARFNELQFYL